jgi:hypothetical protein
MSAGLPEAGPIWPGDAEETAKVGPPDGKTARQRMETR